MPMHSATPRDVTATGVRRHVAPARRGLALGPVSWTGVGLLAVVVVSVLSLAARSSDPADPGVPGLPPAQASPDAGPPQATPPAPKSVQMSLPPDYEQGGRGNGVGATGFRVGFFEPGGAEPFYTFTASRADVRTVSPGVGEIALPALSHPGGRTAVVRVQTLSASGPSAWSDASPPFAIASLRVSTPPTRAERVARPPRPPKRVAVLDLEPFPALKALLAGQKPADMSDEEATGVFRNPRDLAAALVISRDLGLPFMRLHAAIKAEPRKRLVDIVKAMQPATNAARAIDAANRQARSLTNRRKAPVR